MPEDKIAKRRRARRERIAEYYRGLVREYMKVKGVATDIAWKTPPYLQPCMTEKFGYKRGDFPITEGICDTIVSLPMMDYMEEDEISKVISEVNSYEGM